MKSVLMDLLSCGVLVLAAAGTVVAAEKPAGGVPEGHSRPPEVQTETSSLRLLAGPTELESTGEHSAEDGLPPESVPADSVPDDLFSDQGHSAVPLMNGMPGAVEYSSTPVRSMEWQWLDRLELFAGLDGSKQPQDFGVNAQFGGRVSANWAVPLGETGMGVQLGTALSVTDHAVRVTSRVDGASSRSQWMTTAGLFQRTDSGWTWGLVYDRQYLDDYAEVQLSQWRGRVGYLVTESDEVGLMANIPQRHDSGTWAGIPVRLDAIGQGSVFWRRTWEHQAETTFWLGVAEGHAQANVALGDHPPADERLAFGSDLHIPLNDNVALVGAANFILPADTGTVDAWLGLAVYPGGGSYGWRKQKYSPVMSVGGSPSFPVDLAR